MAKKAALKRIKMSEEPALNIHRWVLARVRKGKNGVTYTKFLYCVNKKEIAERKAQANKGDRIFVYRAVHNFKEGFQK